MATHITYRFLDLGVVSIDAPSPLQLNKKEKDARTDVLILPIHVTICNSWRSEMDTLLSQKKHVLAYVTHVDGRLVTSNKTSNSKGRCILDYSRRRFISMHRSARKMAGCKKWLL